MARNFRTDIEHHKENLAGAGSWNSFARINKDGDRNRGYCDYVKVHFLLDDRNVVNSTDSANLLSQLGFGLMFGASHSSATESVDGDSGQLDPTDIISVRTSNGVVGTVSIPIKKVIRSNEVDTAERDGYIYLYCKCPDVTVDDTLAVRFYIETYGRWVHTSGL